VNKVSVAIGFSRVAEMALLQAWPRSSWRRRRNGTVMKYILVPLLMAAAVIVTVELHRALRAYLKFRGKRLVSCPETHKPAAADALSPGGQP